MAAIFLQAVLSLSASERLDLSKTIPKTEHFDKDPGWEGHNNRVVPKVVKKVQQDFGYRATNFVGKAKGEIGGTIWRSPTLASYAAKIPVKTLNNKLTASGTFALTASSGSSGAFFGWFKADRPGGGRQNTLGLRFAGEGSGSRLTLQLVTGTNQACGTKVTPWIVDKTKPRGQGRKFRPPAIKNDGTRYTWTLDYDPLAADGSGGFRCTVRSNSPQLEEFERKTCTVVLPPGYKEQGTTFDRFGLMNSEKPGNSLTIYFDDLVYDGTAEAFSADAGWIGVGNQASYQRREEGGAHDFGFSGETSHAGGKAGELGGVIWRSGVYGYYADKVGPLSLADRLEASGKVMLAAGPPDSGMYLGWFHSAHKENSPHQAGDFVGVRIGGPTRIGHYFAPAYATALRPVSDRAATARGPVSDRTMGPDRRSSGSVGDLRSAGRRGRETAAPRVEGSRRREHPARISVESREGPVLVPRQVFPWKLVYDPDAAGGQGAIHATLGTESVTLSLKPGDKAKGATLDRFGLFTTHIGGNFVRIYFDDLTYTSGSEGKSR